MAGVPEQECLFVQNFTRFGFLVRGKLSWSGTTLEPDCIPRKARARRTLNHGRCYRNPLQWLPFPEQT
jgi:hypothetical protein